MDDKKDKIKFIYYKFLNQILFRIPYKKNGSRVFYNIHNGYQLTVETLRLNLLKQLSTANTEEKFFFAGWWFDRVLKTLPCYFDDDLFTDDESDQIFEIENIFMDWSMSNGASMELFHILKNENLLKSKEDEECFMNLMKKIAPWQFGVHDWKPYEQKKNETFLE